MLLRLYNDDSPLIDHSQLRREKLVAEADSRENDAELGDEPTPTEALNDPPLSNAEHDRG